MKSLVYALTFTLIANHCFGLSCSQVQSASVSTEAIAPTVPLARPLENPWKQLRFQKLYEILSSLPRELVEIIVAYDAPRELQGKEISSFNLNDKKRGDHCELSSLGSLNTFLLCGFTNGAIKLINPKTRACLRTLSGHQGAVKTLLALRGQCFASAAEDNRCKIWDAGSATCLATLHMYGSCALAALRGQQLAYPFHEDIKIWKDSVESNPQMLTGHTLDVAALTTLPNGSLVSATCNGVINVWDVKSGCSIKSFKHDKSISALLAVSDTKIAVGDCNGTISLWDIESGSCLGTWSIHDEPTCQCKKFEEHVDSVEWQPHDYDEEIAYMRFRMNGGQLPPEEVRTQRPLAVGGITGFLLLPNDCLAVIARCDMDKPCVTIFNLNTQKVVMRLFGHLKELLAFCLLPTGHLVSGSRDGEVKIWQ